MRGDLLSRLRCRRLPSILVASLFLASPMGLTHRASASTLDQAEHAYRHGLLDVAENIYNGLLGGEHDQHVVQRLLEIALRSGAWEQAELLLGSKELQNDEGIPFWEAQVALGMNKTRQAEFALAQFVKRHPKHSLALPASLSLATFKLDAGQLDEADALLEPWSDSNDIRVDYVSARLSHLNAQSSLETDDIDDAINRFERLRQNSDGLPRDWLAKVYLGLSMQRLAKRPAQRESAAEILREYLEEFSPSVGDQDAIGLLEEADAFKTPAQRNAWQTWASERGGNLRALIALAISKEHGSVGEYTPAISALDVIEPGQYAFEESLVLRARWSLDGGNATACLTFIEENAEPALAESERLSELLAIKGLAQFEVGRGDDALAAFSRVRGTSEDDELPKVAAFNTAVLTLSSADRQAHEMAMRGLYEAAEPAVQNLLGGEAVYLRALLLARTEDRDPLADEALREFLLAYPIHPRRLEALIARLELALMANIIDPKKVGRCLKLALKELPKDFERDRLQYLELWSAIALGQQGRAQDLITKFRSDFPDSAFLPNVAARQVELRIERGEVDSSVNKSILALSQSGTDGTSVQSGFLQATLDQRLGDFDAAIKEWGRVIDLTEGQTQLLARHGSALVHCLIDDRTGAESQWDEVLRLSRQSHLRVRALIGKGESKALFADHDAKAGEESIRLFQEALTIPDLAVDWRDQSKYRIGMVQLALNSREEALGTFSQVVRDYQERFDGAPLDDKPVCNRWVYRAGFETIALVEAQSKFHDAARRADELAGFNGDRSDEARARAAKIRLQNFIY